MSESKVGVRASRTFPRATLMSLAACCLLAGCMVGPDFHKPRPAVPSSFVNPSAPPTTQTSVTQAQPIEDYMWWRNFDDPVLNSLVRGSVLANLDLRQASSRLREARAQYHVTASGLFPQLNGSSSYTRIGTSGGGIGNSGARSNSYIAGFDSEWELDVFGGVKRSVEAARANIEAAEEDRRSVLVSLAAEVATDYVYLRSFQRQIEIAKENLESEQRTADLTQRKFGAGFVSRLDVANANAQVATTLSQIPALETSAQQEIYALSVLLARDPGSLLEELSAPRPIPLTPPRVPIGLPSELLRRRPDIRRAEALLHAATAEVGVATADLFPRFSLTGNFDFEASKLKAFGNWTSSIWQFGPNMTWPLFTAGRVRANIQVQDALQEQALLTYEQSILTALQDVENALVAYAKEQQRRAALIDAVTYNRQALSLSTRLYNAGQTDFLNVLNAQRSLFSVETALAQSEASVAIDLAALYKALGGGWEISDDAIAYAPVSSGREPRIAPSGLVSRRPEREATAPATTQASESPNATPIDHAGERR